METSKIIFIVSTDNALAREHAQELSALRASFMIWPEQALHPTKHFKQIVHRLKAVVAGDRPLVILTHSEVILAAVGCLVEAKEIAREAVEVRVVMEGGVVRRCRFMIDGFLGDDSGHSWPGFFTPNIVNDVFVAWKEST